MTSLEQAPTPYRTEESIQSASHLLVVRFTGIDKRHVSHEASVQPGARVHIMSQGYSSHYPESCQRRNPKFPIPAPATSADRCFPPPRGRT